MHAVWVLLWLSTASTTSCTSAEGSFMADLDTHNKIACKYHTDVLGRTCVYVVHTCVHVVHTCVYVVHTWVYVVHTCVNVVYICVYVVYQMYEIVVYNMQECAHIYSNIQVIYCVVCIY